MQFGLYGPSPVLRLNDQVLAAGPARISSLRHSYVLFMHSVVCPVLPILPWARALVAVPENGGREQQMPARSIKKLAVRQKLRVCDQGWAMPTELWSRSTCAPNPSIILRGSTIQGHNPSAHCSHGACLLIGTCPHNLIFHLLISLTEAASCHSG